MSQVNYCQINRFQSLRDDLFDAIRKALEEDGHCKSYEGQFGVRHMFPNYFEQQDGDAGWWEITLNCYLIGPHRHYLWMGQTFDECLRKVETDVRAWIAGDDSSRHFED